MLHQEERRRSRSYRGGFRPATNAVRPGPDADVVHERVESARPVGTERSLPEGNGPELGQLFDDPVHHDCQQAAGGPKK